MVLGIPAEDRERIFEPFTRLEDTRNRSTGGYGLGLAIAKRIIDAHHGEITDTGYSAWWSMFSNSIKRDRVRNLVGSIEKHKHRS